MNLSDLRNTNLKDLSRAPLSVKGLAVGFVFLLIVGAGYYLDWSTGIDELRKAQQEEQTLRASYVDKKGQAIHYEAYKQRLADIEQALTAMLRQLPNKSEMDDLLADINQTGIGRGLEFDLFKPGNEANADFYATLPVTIKVTGNYHDIGNFVSDIAKLPRIVTIHDIALAPRQPSAKDGRKLAATDSRLGMDATIRTYRYLDDKELAAQKQASKQAAKKGAKK
jgi:type IV pilus assembly protein PilO